MKKLSLILFVAALAICCVGCNKNSKSESEPEPESVEQTTVMTSASDSDVKEIPMDDEYLSKILTIEDNVPKYEAKDKVADTDFIGLWECQIATNGTIAYSGMYNAPLYAISKLEIKDDNTGKLISATNTGYGYKTTESDFTWSFADSKFTISLDSTNIDLTMSADNQIVLMSKDPTGSDVYAYYGKVDKFTEFDFDSVKFDFDALSK